MIRVAVVAVIAHTACGFGVGPYQPRRDPYATAGGARPGLGFDETSRRAAHQEAKRETVPEIGGGSTAMYAFDGGYYLGVMQGAGHTRVASGEWGSPAYFMQLHAGFFQTLLDDRLTLGANALAVRYASAPASYLALGGELSAKLGVTREVALRLGAGVLHGSAEAEDATTMMKDDDTVSGVRAAGGLDWVIGRLRGNDIVLTIELQYVRTLDVTLAGAPTHVEARALGFELVLVGI